MRRGGAALLVTALALTPATSPAARLQPELDRFTRLYRDVEPGDRYALTDVPGAGTELALNGSRLGVVPGAEVSRAIFSIWFGARPVDAGLERALLGDGDA